MNFNDEINFLIAQRHKQGLRSILPSMLAKMTGASLGEAAVALLQYSKEVGIRNLYPMFMIQRDDPYETKDITGLVGSIEALESEGIEVEGFVGHSDVVFATPSNTYIVFPFSPAYGDEAMRISGAVSAEGNSQGENSPWQ
jgi:hypothetical protein